MDRLDEILNLRQKIIKSKYLIKIKDEYILKNLLLLDYNEYFDKTNLSLFVDTLIYSSHENPKIILPQLFMLLYDINWPGSINAVNFVKTLDVNIYIDELNDALKVALSSNDEDFLFGINYLVDKVYNLYIKNNKIYIKNKEE